MGSSFLERTLVVTMLIAALLACKKKPVVTDSDAGTPPLSTTAAQMAELTPKLKARMDMLSAMAKTAASEPKVRKERPLKTKLETAEFITIGDKWLADVHYNHTDDELDFDDTTLALCGYAVKATEPQGDSLRYAEQCLAWKYIAVIRPRKVIQPVVNMNSKTFKPGQLDGDLLLFDLADGTIVGRYLLGITNSDELTWFEGKPEEEWKEESKRDLVKNTRGVIEERLKLERDSSGTPD